MSSEIFRDRTEGTAAKREELLRRRRDELVTMPHAVRRVVVARSSRIAASMAIAMGGIALITAACSPGLAAAITRALPGVQPAPLSTLLSGSLLVGLVAWAISRARVEHRFAVEMSRYVLPSSDLDHDVERLDHEHPAAIARAMGHRLEVRSAAWPVLAAGVIVPATLLWVGLLAGRRAWPELADVESCVSGIAILLAGFGVASAIAAIAMTRPMTRRLRIEGVALPFGAMVGALAVVGFWIEPVLGWLAGAGAVIPLAMGLVAATLRRERALLAVEDPAAVGELFTLRGAIRRTRALVATARAHGRRIPRRYRVTIGGVGVALLGGTWGAVHAWRGYARDNARADIAAARAPSPRRPLAMTERTPNGPPAPSLRATPAPLEIDSIGGRLRVEAMLDANGEATIRMASFRTLPDGWRATLAVELVSPEPIVIGTDENELRELAPAHPTRVLEVEACGGAKPLSVHVRRSPSHEADAAALRLNPRRSYGTVAFWVVPTVTLATCDE